MEGEDMVFTCVYRIAQLDCRCGICSIQYISSTFNPWQRRHNDTDIWTRRRDETGKGTRWRDEIKMIWR